MQSDVTRPTTKITAKKEQSLLSVMKFGKYLETRQLELPEYNGHFINYKQLKKLMKQLSVPPRPSSTMSIDALLQENKASFFFRLERELEKVNSFYLEKESQLTVKFDILQSKKEDAVNKRRVENKNSIAYVSLHDGFKRFQRDLNRLEQFIELNQTGFNKILKKWDKRSHSHTKEFYLSTAVSVQPVFNRDEVAKLNDACTAALLNLDDIARGSSDVVQRRSNSTVEMLSHLHVKDEELETDELYMEFLSIMLQDHLPRQELLVKFVHKVVSTGNYSTKLAKIFFSAINTKVEDELLQFFYNQAREFIDLNTEDNDNLSKRNIAHEASRCVFQDRTFIVELALSMDIDFNAKDLSGKTPLHYAADLGKLEIVKLVTSKMQDLDILDNDAKTPLILSILKNHLSISQLLLSLGAKPYPISDEDNPQFLPLNVACECNNVDAVKMLLSCDTQVVFQKDTTGLAPLHVVARSGNFELVSLLVQHGADVNAVDGFNKWQPIFYAVIDGHARTTRALIGAGARLDVKDEDGHSPLYHCIWEGHLNVLNVLLPHVTEEQKEQFQHQLQQIQPVQTMQLESFDSQSLISIDGEMDIPDFSLPPPIIPLRKYGHNFLEKKIFVHLVFNQDSLKLNFQNEFTSTPGRMTISSKISDVIPRNLVLPLTTEDDSIVFQIDSLDDFSIDFEVFPVFGTRLVAKTTAISSVFTHNGSASLPLFDSRLMNIGELNFKYHVIFPYSGIPLEISQFDTYWKSEDPNSVLSFVTSSSLSGEYIKVNVGVLNDGTVVVCSGLELEVAPGVFMHYSDLNLDQLAKLRDMSISEPISTNEQLLKLLGTTCVPLAEFLDIVLPDIKLEIDVSYPTEYEIEAIPVKLSQRASINEFVDSILDILFAHARKLRSNDGQSRSVLFSSNNAQICSLLNWKQPNYPVFFNMNGLDCQTEFAVITPNKMNAPDAVNHDLVSRSIKEAVKFSSNNNLLGLMVPNELLHLSHALVESIRSRGLFLVATTQTNENVDLDRDINGVRFENVLQFQGNIDM